MQAAVQFVEINVYDGMAPLVSGYLQSYAEKDTRLAAAWRFDQYATSRRVSGQEILRDLLRTNADVYAFSCYVWNIGIVRSLLRPLREHRPAALFVLGGPQVMHHAEDYLDPADEGMVVCNGEGERTFSALLTQLLDPQPELSSVNGLSFYSGGELVTTAAEPRITDLDEIPSPFLTGVIDPGYRMSVIETNRGCPFRCGFCYWGAANNDKVYRFGEERVREEISWMARNGVAVLHIADANWGMLKRDIELSRHIAECKAQHFYPAAVIFAAAKNSPARVTEITRIFTDAGLVNTQPISMQSLDEHALDIVDRRNIRLADYAELQEDLNDRGIGSYVEMIWPLPGETLASFKRGLGELLERRAASVIVYAHLLLNNTPIHANRKALGLVTRRGHDTAAEAEIIVATNDVNYDDFQTGMWLIYAINALHNTHALQALGAYLSATGLSGYVTLLDAFIAFCRAERASAFTRFCEESIDSARYYDFTNYPAIYHMVLHGDRRGFTDLWWKFCASQEWWSDSGAQMMFELDLLGKPFLYRDTERSELDFEFREIALMERDERGCVVRVPEQLADAAMRYLDVPSVNSALGDRILRVEHPRIPYPFNAGKSEEDIADYCSGKITRIVSILPQWTVL